MKLVILDRDGVINQDSDSYIKSPEEWLPIEGSLEAIARLHEYGFKVAVATNQSGVARGLFDLYTLARIHQKMCNLAEESGGLIDGVFFCPHGPDQGCGCRKPQPGLLTQIASEFEVSLQGVPFVGDSLKDLQAARNAGCRPILVLTGKGRQTLETSDPAELSDVTVVADLREAVKVLTEHTSG
ncbi:MAG: D-glycero-beta-D-manno-heptose 1,7-bisphosphate 7-phosphatase [Gammaproteobacteria bacterium]